MSQKSTCYLIFYNLKNPEPTFINICLLFSDNPRFLPYFTNFSR